MTRAGVNQFMLGSLNATVYGAYGVHVLAASSPYRPYQPIYLATPFHSQRLEQSALRVRLPSGESKGDRTQLQFSCIGNDANTRLKMTHYIIEAVFVLLAGFGLLAALAVTTELVPNPLRDNLRAMLRIKAGQIQDAATTPIERELALIAAPQKIIQESQRQVKDLQGKLVHQRNILEQRRDDQRQAEDAYYKAVDEKSGEYTVQEFLALVADKDQEASIEQQVYDSLEQAVSVSLGAISAATRELRAIQIKVKSDEARGVATQALSNAAKIIESAKSIGSVGSILQKESRAVQEEFERARASFDLAQGSQIEREARDGKQRTELEAVRKRLEERRGARLPQAN